MADKKKTADELLAELTARVEALEQRSQVVGTLAARLARLLCEYRVLNEEYAEKQLFQKLPVSEGPQTPASQAAGFEINRLQNVFLGKL